MNHNNNIIIMTDAAPRRKFMPELIDLSQDDDDDDRVQQPPVVELLDDDDDDDDSPLRRRSTNTTLVSSSSSSLRRRFDASTTAPLPVEGRSSTQPPSSSSVRSHIRHPEREAPPRELLWLLRQSSAPAVRSPDLAESTAVRFPSPRRHRAPAPLRGDPSTRGSRRTRTTLPRRPRHPPLRDLDHVVTQEQLWFLLGTTRTTPAPPPQQYHHHPPEDWDNQHVPTYEELLSMFGMGNENYGASMTDVSLLPVVTITAQDMTTTATCCAATDPDRYRCSICFEDYQVGHHKKILPCFHNFHESCIDPWLVQNGSCPICKHGIACTTTNATTR